jgi:hypothetical protein
MKCFETFPYDYMKSLKQEEVRTNTRVRAPEIKTWGGGLLTEAS